MYSQNGIIGTRGDYMIYSKLSNLMRKKGLTITKLANDTGISRTTLTSLFHNSGNGIQFDTLNVLCNYFHISISELLVFVPYTVEIKLEDIEESSFIYYDDSSECTNTGWIVFTNVARNEQASYKFKTLISVFDNSEEVLIECDVNDEDIFAYQQFISRLPIEALNIIIDKMTDSVEKIIRTQLTNINSDWFGYDYNTYSNNVHQWDKWEIYDFLFDKTNGTK